jgi:hypothetical protein
MKLCLLMNRVYPPYGKWLGTAFATLPCARVPTPHLSAALSARSWQEREQHLSPAYDIAAGLHNELGLTEPLDVKVRSFHDRPFRVLDAYRFINALVSTISDPAVRDLPRSARSTSTSTTPTSPTSRTPNCAAATSQAPDSTSDRPHAHVWPQLTR